MPSRRSLIAPRTRNLSLTSTTSSGPPTISVRSDRVSNDRSRKVDAEKPAVQDAPSGRTAPNTGKRAVVVLAEPAPAVTLRNSGAYWRKRDVRPTLESEAGFIALSGSKSAVDPPLPSARVLICPGG